jgi:CRISPR-associated protein Cas1
MGIVWAVAEQGCILHLDSGALECRKEGELLASVPVPRLERVDCFGAVSVTPLALDKLQECGVGLCFYSSRGRFRALLESGSEGAETRKLQAIRTEDPAFRAACARKLLTAKWEAEDAQAVRWSKGRARPDAAAFRVALAKNRAAVKGGEGDPARLRALEGEAARAYFDLLRAASGRHPWFGPRSRRPPLDPGNALLSFGYSVVCGWVAASIRAAGLEPAWGFYHVDAGIREALAFDLAEPFRCSVDRLALVAVRRGQLSEKDFRREGGGVFLGDAGRKKWLCFLLDVFGPSSGGWLAVREAVQAFKRALKEGL